MIKVFISTKIKGLLCRTFLMVYSMKSAIFEAKVRKQRKLTFLLYISEYSNNYVPHRRGGGHTVFGADPVGVSVSVGVNMTLSCLHDIS